MSNVSPTVLKGRAAAWAGARGRCPNCGRGPLFAGWMKVAPRCTACDYPLGEVETGDGAATFIMQITGLFVGGGALAFNLAYQPALWVNLLIWPPLALIMALGLMRPGKGLMTALNLLRTRAN